MGYKDLVERRQRFVQRQIELDRRDTVLETELGRLLDAELGTVAEIELDRLDTVLETELGRLDAKLEGPYAEPDTEIERSDTVLGTVAEIELDRLDSVLETEIDYKIHAMYDINDSGILTDSNLKKAFKMIAPDIELTDSGFKLRRLYHNGTINTTETSVYKIEGKRLIRTFFNSEPLP